MDTNKTDAEMSEDEIIALAAKIKKRRQDTKMFLDLQAQVAGVQNQLATSHYLRKHDDLHSLNIQVVNECGYQSGKRINVPVSVVPEVLEFLNFRYEELANG